MTHAEHNASPATPPKTGLLASLCAPLHTKGSGAPSSRRVAVTLAALAAALGALAFTAAPALAAQGHAFTSSFNGEPGTHLTNPWGIDVDGAAGVVLVADSSNHQVAKFGLSGAPLEFSGLASNELTGVGAPEGFGTVDSAVDVPSGVDAGDVYVVDYEHNVVDLFNAKGEYVSQLTGAATPQETTPQGAFSTPFAVAVAPATGDVWVLDSGHDTVDEFEPEEAGKKFKYLTQIEAATLGEPLSALQGIALDAAGDVYVAGFNEPAGHFQLDKFKANGVYESVLDPNGGTSVAVDTSTTPNDVYVLEGGLAISRFEATSTTGIPAEQFAAPGGRELQDIAVDSSTHSVYATNYTDSQVDIFTAGETPEAPLTEPAKPIQATTATLRGQLNPGGATGKLEYRFDYNTGASCTGGQSIPVPNGETGEAKNAPVEASATGLQRVTQYTYCLVAINAFGSTRGSQVTFTTLAEAPKIEEQSVTDVSATAATFSATVNPGAATTTYTLEYAPTGGAFTPVAEPEGSGSIPAGIEGVPLTVHVQQGLAPNTAYEFHLVAHNTIETVTSEPVPFATQTAGGPLVLPDGREWELVSPPNKHGALLLTGENGIVQTSASGDAFVSLASQATESDPEGNANQVAILSTRGPAGWTPKLIDPPHDGGTGPDLGTGKEYRFFSNDLSESLVQPNIGTATLSPEATERTPYLRTDYLGGNVNERCTPDTMPCYRPLVTATNDTANPFEPFGVQYGGQPCTVHSILCGPRFAAATPDLSHMILESPVQLTAAHIVAESGANGVYEWSAGHLEAVGIPPEGKEGQVSLAGGATHEAYGSKLGVVHALSNDGQRVILVPGPGDSSSDSPLYLRDVAKQETLKLTESGQYLWANDDATRVFFLVGAPDDGELDECEVPRAAGKLECKLTDLTPSSGGEAAEVVRVLGSSEDGSYLYFLAAGALAPGAHHADCDQFHPEAATCNLYLRHGGVTSLVAPAGGPLNEATRVSPDGRWLEFMSDKNLTGYDTRDAVSGHLDEEVYLFHAPENLAAESGRLTCASCDPTGARPVGREAHGAELVNGNHFFREEHMWLAANIPEWVSVESDFTAMELYQPRFLSDSGRLFFDSHDALVAQDVNGTEDVYEYEPAGEHACSTASSTYSARSGGCVSLISSGTSPEESAFLDASESGGDVFFLTAAKLSARDSEGGLSLYDAHECTGAAPCYPPEKLTPPPCDTEASCKASPTPQPEIYGAPSSATFSGPGNQTPPPPAVVKKTTKKTVKCKKGFVKNKRGKCNKRPKSKKHKAKKSAKGRA